MKAKLVKESLNEAWDDYYHKLAQGGYINKEYEMQILDELQKDLSEEEALDAMSLPGVKTLIVRSFSMADEDPKVVAKWVLDNFNKEYSPVDPEDEMYESSADYYDNMYSDNQAQENIYRENARRAEQYDEESFWKEVAEVMGGELEDYDLEEEGRDINIRMPDGEVVNFYQSWRYDGSPVKPVVSVNGDEVGRIGIWDETGAVAEDYLELYQRYKYGNAEQEEDY